MARVLIVGCGCRGCELALALTGDGHAVRGTSRSSERLDRIEAAGAEAVLADPGRLVTLMPHLEGVSVVAWLMGGVGEPALHGPRLESMLETLVDTPVRGFVYEATGAAGASLLAAGAGIVRRAGATWRMPVEIVEAEPWRHEMRAAVTRVLGA
jgi:nucleoside-diphosphate-sugar epimerase